MWAQFADCRSDVIGCESARFGDAGGKARELRNKLKDFEKAMVARGVTSRRGGHRRLIGGSGPGGVRSPDRGTTAREEKSPVSAGDRCWRSRRLLFRDIRRAELAARLPWKAAPLALGRARIPHRHERSGIGVWRRRRESARGNRV